MGSSQTSTTNQTSTQTANPQTQQAVGSILSQVPGLATGPNSQYSSNMNQNVAGLTPQQLQAIQGLGSVAQNNPASNYITQAANYSQLASSPDQVNALTAAYYNPMSANVMAQLQNTFGQQSAQLQGNEAASGAIGGSRASVANSTLANQQGLAAGQTLANLYSQAQQQAQTTAGQEANTAYTLGNLGNEALNTQITGLSAGLQGGNQLQQQQQNVYNAATQNAIQSALYTPQYLSQLGNLSGIGSLLGGTTTGQGTTTTPIDYTGMLLGAAATGLGAYAKSDERVKHDIHPIGTTYDKQQLYSFKYIGDPQTHIGLMAQEVERKHPSAVKRAPDGLRLVDYAKATSKSAKLAEHRKPRAIGGGVGIGNGTSGLEGFSGLQNPMQQYFAQTPQVNVPQANFPTLNLNPQQQGPSQAQQQLNKQSTQFMDALAPAANKYFDKPTQATLGSWDTSVQPSSPQPLSSASAPIFAPKPDFGGDEVQFGAHGGRIHRPYGGGVNDDPNSIQAANDAFLNNNQGFGLGSAFSPITPANAAISPAVAPDLTPSTTNQLDKSAPLAPIGSPAPSTPPTMGMPSGQYYDLNDDGTRKGAPQIPPRDPALVMASIGSPAQAAPAPIATPQQQPSSPYFETGHPYYASLRASESGDNPYAQAPTSSAYGPYQFTAKTWHNDVVVRHPELGLTDQDRLNPAAQEKAIVPFTKDKQSALIRAGQEPTETNTKMAHFLGDAGAMQFLGALKADPKTPAVSVATPEAVAANHNVFYNEDGTPKTVGEVHAAFNAKPTGGAQPRSSVLDRPDLQPPDPSQSNYAQIMKQLGFPSGAGSDLAGAIGSLGSGSISPQAGNALFNLGIGMMAAGPSVGVKGFPGAAISALSAAGKGGQFALNQEQTEREQARRLAETVMSNKLHEAQMQRALKPEWQTIRKELVPSIDPVTKTTYWKEREVKGWVNPFTQEITEQPQPPVAPLQTPGTNPSSANAASAPASAMPGGVTFTQADGSEAPVPTAIADKFNPEDPIDQLSLRIISGQASMPKSQRQDPRYIALKKRVYELDPTYNENRSDFYKQYAGPNGKTQLSYDAFGTALKHAHTLDDANWNNNLTDWHFGPLTEIPQAIQRAKGNPKLKDYENTATAYADEHYRALVPSGAGTQKERERAESTVSASTPRPGRLAGNAANVDILLGKMLKLDDKYNKNMGVAASINKPQLLTPDDRQIIRDIFAHDPDPDLKRQRYERYGKDPRTADLVSPPKEKKEAPPAQAQPQQQSAPSSKYQEGQTATGPNGQKMIFRNGHWVAQ